MKTALTLVITITTLSLLCFYFYNAGKRATEAECTAARVMNYELNNCVNACGIDFGDSPNGTYCACYRVQSLPSVTPTPDVERKL